MLFHIAIHRPRPGKESRMEDAMRLMHACLKKQEGLVECHILRDTQSGARLGFAKWENEEALAKARPAMQDAVKDVPFGDLEDDPPEVFLLESVE